MDLLVMNGDLDADTWTLVEEGWQYIVYRREVVRLMTTLNELRSEDEQSAAVAAITLKESIIPKLRKDKEDRDRRAAADADAGRNERKDEMLFGKSCDPPTTPAAALPPSSSQMYAVLLLMFC